MVGVVGVAGADTAVLLRAHRRAADMTIEELAAASGVSARAISDIERGRTRGPQPRTVAALADALALSEAARRALLHAARDGRLSRLPETSRLCALPADLPDFVGRQVELTELSVIADPRQRPRLTVVSGTGGLGTSALAIRAAHHHAASFPDGVLHLDLRGLDADPVDPYEALARLLRALGAREVPVDPADRSALYRRLLAEREVLIVLDNARAEAQVRPLLIVEGNSSVIVTSRRLLTGLAHARRLVLGPWSDEEAVAFLATAATAAPDSEALQAVARSCGNFPLALRIVGNRLVSVSGWTLRDLADRLSRSGDRLSLLVAGDLRVTAALAPSYEQLEAGARLLFRRLSLVHAGAGAELAAVVAGIDVHDAARLLDELVEVNLLVALPGGRVGFHDLVALFAAGCLNGEEGADQRAASTDRMHEWLLATARNAGLLFAEHSGTGWGTGASGAGARASAGTVFATSAAAHRWLREERGNWLAALGAAASAGRDEAVLVTSGALEGFAAGGDGWPGWTDVFGWSVAAAQRLGDDRALAVHLTHLSMAMTTRGRAAEALQAADRAVQLARATEERAVEAWAEVRAGEASTGDAKLRRARRAGVLFEQVGDVEGRLSTVRLQASGLWERGNRRAALRTIDQLLHVLEEPEPTLSVEHHGVVRTWALQCRGRMLRAGGDLQGAARAHLESIAVAEERDVPLATAAGHEALAQVERQRGRVAAARGHLQVAQEIFARIGEEERSRRVQVLLDRWCTPDEGCSPSSASA
ncbi:helix-turn-helix domain-containing protein [Kineococcus sp. SYSU DK005]|uniref:helix-turn-helix domain-containing protein n=1 Tax=Kineococcus sp. SYSU DK005 TaxID=3383126 RepID=UPI003D7D7711